MNRDKKTQTLGLAVLLWMALISSSASNWIFRPVYGAVGTYLLSDWTEITDPGEAPFLTSQSSANQGQAPLEASSRLSSCLICHRAKGLTCGFQANRSAQRK